MTSMVSSKNKGKKAKRKNSVKKNRPIRKKKRYKETASPRVEPGLSTRASNSLTTTPQ